MSSQSQEKRPLADGDDTPSKRVKQDVKQDYDNLNHQTEARALGVLDTFVSTLPPNTSFSSIEAKMTDQGEMLFTNETGQPPIVNLAGSFISFPPEDDGTINVICTPTEEVGKELKTFFLDTIPEALVDDYKLAAPKKGSGLKPIIPKDVAEKCHGMHKAKKSKKEIKQYFATEVVPRRGQNFAYHPFTVDADGKEQFKFKIKPFKERKSERLTEETLAKIPVELQEAGRNHMADGKAYVPATVIGTEGDPIDYCDIPAQMGRRRFVGCVTIQLRRISPGKVPYTVATPITFYLCACTGSQGAVTNGPGSRGLFD